jgi:hypothetical protein
VFALEGGGGPPPGQGNRIACESPDYLQNFCAAGTPVRRAWVAERRSQAPCIEGQTWGHRGDGGRVDQGGSAIFAFESHRPFATHRDAGLACPGDDRGIELRITVCIRGIVHIPVPASISPSHYRAVRAAIALALRGGDD